MYVKISLNGLEHIWLCVLYRDQTSGMIHGFIDSNPVQPGYEYGDIIVFHKDEIIEIMN